MKQEERFLQRLSDIINQSENPESLFMNWDFSGVRMGWLNPDLADKLCAEFGLNRDDFRFVVQQTTTSIPGNCFDWRFAPEESAFKAIRMTPRGHRSREATTVIAVVKKTPPGDDGTDDITCGEW